MWARLREPTGQFWTITVVATLVRLGFLAAFGTPFSFDAYQRWAGRDTLFVQDWLPLTQSVIWLCNALGFDVIPTRRVFCVIGGLAAGFAALSARGLARRVAGEDAAERAGWWMLGAATFPPAVFWSTTLYQEGPFLALFFGALAAFLSGRSALADSLVFLLGFTRYEAWPVLLLWVAFRQTPGSVAVLLSPAVWTGARLAGLEGGRFSPPDFKDWNGMADRFVASEYLADLGDAAQSLFHSGGALWLFPALAAGRLLRREPLGWLVGAAFLAQLAAAAAWMAALGGYTTRMMVLPVCLVAVLGAVAVGAAAGRRPRWLGVGLLGLVLLYNGYDTERRFEQESRARQPERSVAGRILGCRSCVWCVAPRVGLGTRDRHDGCEAIQGMGKLREGEAFTCLPWHDPAEVPALLASCTSFARWDTTRRAYLVWKEWDHDPDDLVDAPLDAADPGGEHPPRGEN